MSNMSYCRFRNTDNDLADCVLAMEEILELGPESDSNDSWRELSGEERDAMERMKTMCESFLDLFNRIEAEIKDFETEVD